MGNRCLEKSSSCAANDENNFKRDNVLINPVENVSECSDLKNNVKVFNGDQAKGEEDSLEISNQIDSTRLSFHPEVILRPNEDSYPAEAKRLRLDKENDMTIISIYPTLHNNFQDLLKYNNIHNGFGAFINSSKCLNINLNNQIPFIPMIYNASIEHSAIPNYITLNDVIPNKMLKSNEINMQQIVIASTQSCTEVANLPIPKVQDSGPDDDDVVFVKEYKIEKSKNSNQDINKKIDEENSEDKHKNEKCDSPTRGRKRRGILVEKRKNPLRKAQMDKASIKLAENLSIPPAVFNARIPSKKTKQPINNQKVIRQSCRTTGAILCPPSPLSQSDFKEWPTEGLHEIPWYNEKIGIIERFKSKNETSETFSAKSFSKEQYRSSPHTHKVEIEPTTLSILAHNRLHLSLDYINELKEFESLTRDTKKGEDERDNQDSLSNVSSVLYDTCELYSLLNNTSLLSVAKYIESFNLKS